VSRRFPKNIGTAPSDAASKSLIDLPPDATSYASTRPPGKTSRQKTDRCSANGGDSFERPSLASVADRALAAGDHGAAHGTTPRSPSGKEDVVSENR
jgi:hypothetical protein